MLESRRGYSFLEDLIYALELEEGFDVRSIMHKDFPEHFEIDKMLQRCKRPASAVPSSSSGYTFGRAFSGRNRVTASKCESWTIGQAPRSPRVDVPGPGFYCDRSLQRAVCSPNAGEFVSAGMPRTKCSSVMNSCSGRFGCHQDLYVPNKRRPAARRRPASAPSGMHSSASAPSLSSKAGRKSKRVTLIGDVSDLSGIASQSDIMSALESSIFGMGASGSSRPSSASGRRGTGAVGLREVDFQTEADDGFE
mmetsp:Transcript_128825/g.227963  ORF Transcript_128825/g.227963 Transcript_128825/m.227963 type:complete len:251 (-) Transcript_128825:54-806(-)